VVTRHQIAVDRTEQFGRQRLARLCPTMDFQLELGEHGLPEECSANIFQLLDDQIAAQDRVIARSQQVIGQQRLVQRGSDFSDKDGVVAINVGLRLAREVRVHRMTEFVRQRKHVVQSVLGNSAA
jgi:hypothetical protein